MTPGKKAMLVLARAGMELSWRYAWVGFLMLLICHQVFPLLETAGVFITAIVLNQLSAKRNWLLYQSLLLEAAGLILFALLILYRLWYETVSFFSHTWINALFLDPKSLPQKFTLLLVLFCLLLIWRGGRALVKHPLEYEHVCIQFDKGVGLFILLLLVKFLIQEKADILVDGLALGFLVGAFFIFSLLSIFLSRKQPDVKKSFMTGYRGIGITLSILWLFVLFGSGVTFLCYPVLTQVADSSLAIAKNLSEPLVPVLVTILLFLFSPGKIRLRGDINTNNPELPADLVNASVNSWMTTFLNIVSMGLLVAIGIIALFFFGIFLKYLIRLLLGKNTQNNPHNITMSWVRYVAGWFFLLPVRVLQGLVAWLKRAENAAAVYAELLRWGHHSGFRLLSGETPNDYGNRLIQRFPDLRNEIAWIVDAFNKEIYGQVTIERHILLRLRSALRRMKHPRYWSSRIRTSFFQ